MKQKSSGKKILFTALLVGTLVLSGCGKGSGKNIKIEGVQGPNVNFVDNKLTMTLVIDNLEIDYGARFKIPRFENSYVEIGPDFQSNGYLLGIGIDVVDIKKLLGKGADTLDPTTLPGGRPLPGVVEGQLPGLAMNIPKLANLSLYLGKTVLGVFIPVKLPVKDYIGTFRFYDGMGVQVGNVSVVGKDSTDKNSGVLLLINLKGRIDKIARIGLALN